MEKKKLRHIYRIIGKDLRYGTQDSWGDFDNLKDCLVHMDALNRSWGDIIKFKWEEVWEELSEKE
jgi:hypothetical protein